MTNLELNRRDALLAAAAVGMASVSARPAAAQSTAMRQASDVTVAPGVSLHVVEWGPTDGAPIILLHGWPLSHRIYEGVGLALAERGFRVIAYDQRGFGASDKPWGTYDLDVLADDLEAVLADLELQNITLGGFSMGGAVVANHFARHGTGRVGRYAFVGAAAPALARQDGFPEGVDPDIFTQTAAAVAGDRAALSAGFARSCFSGEVSEEMIAWLTSIGLESAPKAMSDMMIAMREMDLRDAVSRIDIPALVIHSADDAVCPYPLTGAILAEQIAGARLVQFEDAGHAVMFTRQAETVEAIADFASA